ncbi:hypothetical protein NDU88_005410 [Pleurodeles waltl]|uniref:Uncharacterized protein n=1 Tax=Pleurodeles waltl TaxID=8319 RepID=A0AAV7WBD0_PLEWA|nr:hypothetical protein NDU88_005410 [Pleurodeles waltl]
MSSNQFKEHLLSRRDHCAYSSLSPNAEPQPMELASAAVPCLWRETLEEATTSGGSSVIPADTGTTPSKSPDFGLRMNEDETTEDQEETKPSEAVKTAASMYPSNLNLRRTEKGLETNCTQVKRQQDCSPGSCKEDPV